MDGTQRHPTDPLQILLIEDNPGDARLFKNLVRESEQAGEVRWKEDLASGLSAAEERRPDVIALGLGTADHGDVQPIERIVGAFPALPIVVLTRQQSEELALSALDGGATEYLRKDEWTPSLLGRTLRWAAERKSMERKLREREQQFRSIAENISEGIYRSVPGEGLIYVNQAFADLFGYESPEEITSVDPVELYVRSERRKELRDLLRREGSFQNEEVECRRKDGSTFTVLQSGSVVRDEAGEIVSFDGAVTDITERRRRRRKLERQNDLFEQAEEIANVGAWEYDVQAEEITLTDQAYRVHGLAPSNDMTPDRSHGLFHPEDRPEADEAFRRAIEEGEPYDLEARLITEEGEERWVRTRGEPQCEEGEVIRVCGAIQDITDQKEAERELAESEERYRTLAQHFPNGAVGVYDRDLRYTLAEGEQLGEHLPSPERLEGDRMPDIFPDSTASDLEPMFRAAVQEGVSGETETTFGGRIWRVWATPLRNPDGEIFAGLSYAQDITEHKEREDALRQQRNLLEQTQRLAGGWHVNPKTEEVSWSEEVYRIHDLPPGTEVGLEEAIDFFEPEAQRELRRAFERCIQERETYDLELPLRTASGERRWVRTVGAPSEVENGEVIQVSGAVQDITERREAEQALKEREEYLSVTLQSIGDAVITTDRDGCITEMNAVAERLTGWSQEKAEGELLDEVLTLHSARTGELVGSPAEEVLRKGKTIGLANHTVLTSRDGTEYQIADSAAPIQAEDGDLRGVVLVFRDVTEEYERRRQMARQNDLFSKAQDLAQVGAWEYDVRSGEAMWTEGVFQIHGLSPDVEATPKRSLQFYHEEDRPVIEEAFARAVEEGEPYDLDLRLLSADGEKKWIRTRGEPQFENGEVVRVRGTIQDVTDQKRYEQELERVTDLLRLAEEMTDVGGWSVDVRGGRPYQAEWTENLYTIFGLSPEEEPPTEEVFEYYHPEDRERHREAVYRAEQTGEGWDQELRLIRADGAERWVQNIGVPVTEEGEVVNIRGAIQDITERKERERELRQAKEKAERMNRLKSAFLANMSHEIRTPLTSIIGFAEMIDDEVAALESGDTDLDFSTLSRYASLIRKGGQRLMEMLEDVLDLSKLEAGEMNLSEETVDVKKEVRDIVEQFQPQVKDAGLDLRAECSAEGVWAHVDPEGLRIALRNLVNNATKYTEGGGQVWVRVRGEEAAVIVEVEDTGIGMDPERVPELFEAFVQESEGIGREYEGSGLGLTVTKEVINQMGGTIQVETEKGEGSCFAVRLPRPQE